MFNPFKIFSNTVNWILGFVAVLFVIVYFYNTEPVHRIFSPYVDVASSYIPSSVRDSVSSISGKKEEDFRFLMYASDRMKDFPSKFLGLFKSSFVELQKRFLDFIFNPIILVPLLIFCVWYLRGGRLSFSS